MTFWYYFKFFTVLASTNTELFIKIIVVYSLKGSWKARAWFVIDVWQLHQCQCVSCWLSIFNCLSDATGQLVQFKPFWIQFVDFSVEESYEYISVACKSYLKLHFKRGNSKNPLLLWSDIVKWLEAASIITWVLFLTVEGI